MVVPPSYASPLWPPAGFALAGLLIWGRHLWLAVLLGSTVIEVLAGYQIRGEVTDTILISSCLIGTGYAIQALAASWLSEKRLGAGVPRLDNSRQILLFFLLTGPLACLIAASIGVFSIVALNLLPISLAAETWFNWWIGDSLGVFIISPLLFCLFAEPRELWAPRRSHVALSLLVTLVVLTLIFMQVYRAEKSRIQLAFNNQAVTIDLLLTEYANNAIDSTLSLSDFYKTSEQVSRQEFAVFSHSLLKRHPEVHTLEWVPLVTRDQLSSFEQAIQNEGYQHFKVVERDMDGTLRPVSDRAEYFPVTYIEPMLGNEKAFGFDSTTNPISLQSKQLARTTGKTSVSQRLSLIQREDMVNTVLLSIPIYRNESDKPNRQFIGFISAVIHPARMLETALQGLDTRGFSIQILDLNAPVEASVLYSKLGEGELNASYDLIPWQKAFLFCDRTWKLIITPDNSFLVAHRSPLPWVTLFGGLFFTSLLSFLLLTISGRTAYIEALIKARTTELEAANAELKAAEETLYASENYLRTLVDTQPECIKLLARDGSLLHLNPAGLRLIGAESLEQAPFDRFMDLLLPHYRQAYKEMLNQVFSGESVILEFEIISLKGQHRWMESHAVPMRDSEGNIVALLGLTRDISKHKQMESALRENEQKLNDILDNLSVYVYLKDTEGRYLYVNRLVCELWDTTPENVLGHTDEQFFDAETAAATRANDRRVLVDGETLKTEETHVVQKTGKSASYWSTKLPFRNELGDICGLIGISTDITERKQADDHLKLAARVFGEAHEGILITDANGNIIDVNPTFCEITGYSHDEILGKNPNILQSGKHDEAFYRDMWQALMISRHWQGEVWNRKKNGELYAELLTISALCDELGDIRYYVGLFSDITQSKEQQQMLELLAHYDPLTHLPNRTLFADRLLQAIARSKRNHTLLAICFLDLDGFKPVNDLFGHNVGDQVLIEVANRIKDSLREEDSVSRHGGDEFALLLSELNSLEQCEQAILRIHEAIIRPYSINNQTVIIGVSSGITIFPFDNTDPDTLLRHADHAMYQAKLAGKNRYHLFDANQDQLVINKRKQASEIETAFVFQQFQLYYQPKINLKTGQITGVEALIRWLHPQRGMVPPMEFLPFIASSELEIQIGNWVIEQGWRQLCEWHSQGLQIEVSVNISGYHLLWTGFISQLEATLASNSNVASRYLQLEILESTALDDLSAVYRVVKTCRDGLGVTTALDDFGTGYSSLTHLRQLPVDSVKIDRSFVRDMLDDPDDYAIVESVIGLSQAFRREVVAEGVENPEQGSMLLLMGCQLAQGYVIAKPMPAAEITGWIENYRPYREWTEKANAELNAEQTQIAIRRIDVAYWLKRMQICLTSEPDNMPIWPLMDSRKSYFGRWLKLTRHHEQFNILWLEKTTLLYESLFQKGDELKQQFLAGEVELARSGFTDLQIIQQSLDKCLSEYP